MNERKSITESLAELCGDAHVLVYRAIGRVRFERHMGRKLAEEERRLLESVGIPDGLTPVERRDRILACLRRALGLQPNEQENSFTEAGISHAIWEAREEPRWKTLSHLHLIAMRAPFPSIDVLEITVEPWPLREIPEPNLQLEAGPIPGD